MKIIDYNISNHADNNIKPRQRIVNTASYLFYREGIRCTGIDLIIAESKVAKATFYRHFSSKDALINECLQHYHKSWLEWFRSELQRNHNVVKALIPVLQQWFNEEGFRGCALVNSDTEVAAVLPQVTELTRQHQQTIISIIHDLLPPAQQHGYIANDLNQAVQGAITCACFDDSNKAIDALERTIKAILSTR